MNNELNYIGLIKVNGNIISKQKYINELDFIKKYSLSDEEKLILEELKKITKNKYIY